MVRFGYRERPLSHVSTEGREKMSYSELIRSLASFMDSPHLHMPVFDSETDTWERYDLTGSGMLICIASDDGLPLR